MIDMTNDAVFLPGKIHGCEDEIYIIYFNPDAADGVGCFEIEVCDYETLLQVFKDADGDPDEFFGILPDYFHGKWFACYSDSEYFEEYVKIYETADFIGDDSRAEMEFIVKWATEKRDSAFRK